MEPTGDLGCHRTETGRERYMPSFQQKKGLQFIMSRCGMPTAVSRNRLRKQPYVEQLSGWVDDLVRLKTNEACAEAQHPTQTRQGDLRAVGRLRCPSRAAPDLTHCLTLVKSPWRNPLCSELL